MTTTTATAPGKLGKWLLLPAVLFLAIGLVAIFHPLVTAVTTGLVLALCFMLAGVSALLANPGTGPTGHRVVAILFGGLAIGVGALLIFFPVAGAVDLVWFVGAIFAAVGLTELVNAMRFKKHRALQIAIGLLDLAVGVLTLFMPPDNAMAFLAVLVGVSFILRSAALLAFALVLRRMRGVTS